MNITFRQLQAFVTVAEHQSFTKASTHLYITQSALSGLIKELEKTLDTRLFDRTTRQLSLSTTGEHLLPYAQRVLNELNVFKSEITSFNNLEQGKVRLAVSQQFASSALPTLITKFNNVYPNIKVIMVDCSVEEVLKRVQTTDVDIGLGAEREHNDDIDAQFIFELPFYAVLYKSHPLVKQREIGWQQLQHEKLITLQGPFTKHLLDDLANSINDGQSKFFLQETYKVNFLSTALGLTKEELGLTLCLSYAHDWVEQYGLEMRPLKNPVINRRFFLYRRHSRTLSPPAEAFYHFLVKNLFQQIT